MNHGLWSFFNCNVSFYLLICMINVYSEEICYLYVLQIFFLFVCLLISLWYFLIHWIYIYMLFYIHFMLTKHLTCAFLHRALEFSKPSTREGKSWLIPHIFHLCCEQLSGKHWYLSKQVFSPNFISEAFHPKWAFLSNNFEKCLIASWMVFIFPYFL